MGDLLIDAVRVGHLFCFAVGIGAAAFLEITLIRRFRNGIEIEGLRLLLAGHDLIKLALYGLWATGVLLLLIRLAPFTDLPSAKLLAKLIIVSLLTLNMVIIDRGLIPEIFEYEDRHLSDIPGETLMQFGAVAGFSAGCWICALLLGAVTRMKTMGALELASVLLPILAAAVLAGVAAGKLAPRTARAKPDGAFFIRHG